MRIVYFKKITSIVLSAVLVTASLWCTSSSAAASVETRADTASSGELAYVTNMQGHSISVIDTESKVVIDTISMKENPNEIAVTPDGKEAYVGVISGVSIVDIKSKATIATVSLKESPHAIAITPDGSYAYVACHGNVSIIDTKTHALVKTISIGNYNHAIAISPDGSQAYVSYLGCVSVIDTQSQTVVQTMAVGVSTSSPDAIAFRPLKNEAYVAHHSFVRGTVSIINTANRKEISTISLGEGFIPNGVVFTPDGTKAYVTAYNFSRAENGNDRSKVVVIDTKARRVTHILWFDQELEGIAITADGKQVYVSDREGDTVRVIHTETNQIDRDVISVGNFPSQIAIAPRPL
jgi:YVTN family beta-propeller protein